jgi:hypothetical protein
MLYAARAALSEEERNAKVQDLREAVDYEAGTISAEQAAGVLADGDRFVSAVASMLTA